MKIAVLLSGGVDSSLALKLLQDQGHEIEAFYLKIWLEDELLSTSDCPWEEDLKYVRATCEKLNVPLNIISLQEEYKNRVIAYTLSEVKEGRTPNPDVLCNKYIKFGIFFDKISPKFEKIATGHYAQIIEKDDIFLLKRSPDQIKDQSYFLCKLSQEQLKKAMFPVGHLTKEEVRSLAYKFDLPSKDRKDSQGICFLGKFKFSDFIKNHIGTLKGDIREFESNKYLGAHEGHWFYTIGQREGIKLSAGPWYVAAKNPINNTIYVSNQYENLDNTRKNFIVTNLEWMAIPKDITNLCVKVRHKTTPKKCSINFIDEKNAEVELEIKDQGIAPGQFAVFYKNDICQGSGIIK